MKRLLQTTLLLLICLSINSGLQAQYVTIPNAQFRGYLKYKYPTCFNANDEMDTQCSLIKNETELAFNEYNFSDITGIEYFTSLQSLQCGSNKLISLPTLPGSLKTLFCTNNQLTSLPPLPGSLTFLNCGGNQLTSLPTLPGSLTWVNFGTNKLTSLPTLPGSLTWFDCSGNQLTSLPSLPASLIELNCSGNPLTSWPPLPGSLTKLTCYYSQLTSLPTLPSSLTTLDCPNNQLTSLLNLPPSLKNLNCDHNQLTNLPVLPASLTDLDCAFNQITSLPSLPASLKNLACHYNQLKCLPLLPQSLTNLAANNNFITCLPNLPNTTFTSSVGKTLCNQSNNSNNCTVYPLITGKVFLDVNKNGIQDSGENGCTNAIIEIQPGNYLTQTDANGNYSIFVDIGTYTINVIANNYPHYTITPSNQTATFIDGQVDNDNNFAFQSNGQINDLKITLTSLGNARPGRSVGYIITYQNFGTTTLSGDVSFDYDAQLNYDSTSIAFVNHSGNHLVWNYSNLNTGESRNIRVYFTLPQTITLGTNLNFTAKVNPLSGDNTPYNNTETLKHTVTGSYDPNFKEVLPEGNITPSQVESQDPFTYVVHFQNTGTDTAFVVNIKDTISTNFEILKIETIASSHNYSFKMKNGAAEWKLDNILLVDSITNEPLSHGFVKYRVIPKNTLAIGDEIKNTAHIFFDYNEPVKTNTTLNRVTVPTTISQSEADAMLNLFPNPTKGSVTLNYSLAEQGSIKVLSTDGRTIHSHQNLDFSTPITLDLNAEQKGIYFVQVTIGDKVVMKKVVLQ